MQSFWQQLPKPFAVMAPLADVTDPAWRALVAKCGKPDVTFTEFVSADGLYHTLGGTQGASLLGALRSAALGTTPRNDAPFAPPNPLLRDLQFRETERPIVAQLFTAKPEMMAYAANLAKELGFDGVDINMGCPDRAIERQAAGAALIKTPKLAQELIDAAKRASTLPVSVKTRMGFNTESLDEWIPALLEAKPVALTVHLRTRKEMSLVPAHWDLMPRVVAMRDRLAPETLIIGNGDVKSLAEAREKCQEYGCDGVMIGRGVFGNPWLFERSENSPEVIRGSRSLEEKLTALTELAYAFEALTPKKNFAILKKHIKAFVTGFDGASELRARLMEAENAHELEAIIGTSIGHTHSRGRSGR